MQGDSPTDPRARLRASDQDRELVLEQLKAYLDEGRLTVDEFEDRTAKTYGSKTYGELWEVTRDLPAPRTRSGPPVRSRPRGHPHPAKKGESVGTLAGTFAVINVFLIAIWAITGAGYFWPIWPMLGCGLVVGLTAVGSQGKRRR